MLKELTLTGLVLAGTSLLTSCGNSSVKNYSADSPPAWFKGTSKEQVNYAKERKQPIAKEITLGKETIKLVYIPGQKKEDSFYMAIHELTNAQYGEYKQHNSGSYTYSETGWDRKEIPLNQPNQPIVNISFEELQDFCKWLSKKSKQKIDLPTVEEWEACHSRDKIEHYNIRNNRYDEIDPWKGTCDVGLYEPSKIGIYDMIGNASEITKTDTFQYDKLHGKVLIGISYKNYKDYERGGFRDPLTTTKSSPETYSFSLDKNKGEENAGCRLILKP